MRVRWAEQNLNADVTAMLDVVLKSIVSPFAVAGFSVSSYAKSMSMQKKQQFWPYPRWIAHRGAGKLAPENTLAAFKTGHEHGFSMFECDVKLSKDGVPFLLHDASLSRTTSGQGLASEMNWKDLSALDAGGWHSTVFKNEPLLGLQNLCIWLLQNRLMVNLELKPSVGEEAKTGQVVAQAIQTWWDPKFPWPLLSSFQADALRAAQAQSPCIPRALLFDNLNKDWLKEALALDCVAIVPLHTLLTATIIEQAHAEGLRVLTYTVNDPSRAQILWDMGLDGIITDAVNVFNPASASGQQSSP